MTAYHLTVVGPMVNRRGKPPRAGWLNANDRIHWAQRSKLTALWRANAYQALQLAGIPRLNRVHITATFVLPNARHRDHPNLYPSAKAVIDGITDHCETIRSTGMKVKLTGCLPDDGFKHVEGPDMRMRIERGIQLPTIELAIIDLEAGDDA